VSTLSEPRGYGFHAEQLVRLRKKQGLSQRELAVATGLSRMGIVKYEQGLSEPRMDSVELLARELGVEPKVFFSWEGQATPTRAPQSEEELGPPPPRLAVVPPRIPAHSSADPVQTLAHNLTLLGQMDLGALRQLLEALTSSNNPLEYDQDLYDRDLEELRQAGPGALHGVRDLLSMSIHDVSELSGLTPARLLDIEARRGIPLDPQEIMALRKALGVKFEPRAMAVRTSVLYPQKDRRSGRTLHKESLREWQQRCQRQPNKLDALLLQLRQMEERVSQRLATMESSLETLLARLEKP
jgi:transcriptional regulator with XRE-family HTH domain